MTLHFISIQDETVSDRWNILEDTIQITSVKKKGMGERESESEGERENEYIYISVFELAIII